MRRMSIIACAAVLAATIAAAQTRPDFSGTWAHDPQQSAAPAAPAGSASAKPSSRPTGGVSRFSGGGGATVELRIAQTDSSLTIERVAGSSTRKFVHTFDGKGNVNVNGRSTLRSTSRWNGSRLVTEGTEVTSLDAGDVTSLLWEVRSIGPTGELVVETTRTTEGRETTSRQVYKKKKP